MTVKATHLRNNIYRILDRIAKTGIPVEVERKGQYFQILPKKKKSKLANLKKKKYLKGAPMEYAHIDWTQEWSP